MCGTLRTASGATDSDDVMVLVENVAQAPDDPANSGPYVFSDSHVSRVHAYKRTSPFAAALAHRLESLRCRLAFALAHRLHPVAALNAQPPPWHRSHEESQGRHRQVS
jgi:hypothetical protein